MATAGVINGTDLLVYISSNAIAGASSHTLSMTRNMRDTTNKDTAGYRTVMPGRGEWTVSGSGMVAFDATYGISEMFGLWKNSTECALSFKTEDAADTYWTGSAYISDLSVDAPDGDNTTYSFTFTGTGALTQLNS